MQSKPRTFGRILLIATMAVAVPAVAVARHHGGPHGEHGKGEVTERIMDRLELTEAQRAEVKALKTRFEEDTGTSSEHVRVLRANLMDTVHAVEFDEQAIREAAAQLATFEADLAVARAMHLQDFRAILTPEQQDEIVSIHETLRMLHEERGERHRFPSHD